MDDVILVFSVSAIHVLVKIVHIVSRQLTKIRKKLNK